MSVKFYPHRDQWKMTVRLHGRKSQLLRIWLDKQHIRTEAEAVEYEHMFLALARKKAPLPVTDNRIRSIWERYEGYIETNKQPRTAEDVHQVGKHICRLLGDISVDNLTNEVPEYYKKCRKAEISERKGRPVSNRTINKELVWLSGMATYCTNVLKLPVELKIHYLPHHRKMPMILSIEEAAALILNAEPFYQCLFGCLYLCGMRSNEARMLKWEHIGSNRLATVTGKGDKERIVPVPEWLYSALMRMKGTKKEGYVFLNERFKQPVVDFRAALKRTLKASKIEKHVTPHTLRHTFGAHAVMADINMRVLQSIFGHADVSTTEWYSQVAAQSITKASNQVIEITPFARKKALKAVKERT